MKVQHKQIRPSDQHQERNHHSGTAHGVYDMNPSFRVRSSSSLPPSGPMAGVSSSSWYGNSRTSLGGHHAPGGSLAEGVDGAAGQPQEPQQQPSEERAIVTLGNPKAGSEGDSANDSSKSPISSPLTGLEPLRQSLPDVGNGD